MIPIGDGSILHTEAVFKFTGDLIKVPGDRDEGDFSEPLDRGSKFVVDGGKDEARSPADDGEDHSVVAIGDNAVERREVIKGLG